MPRELDALVVGAGPAGSATALRLARCGLQIALLERSNFAEPRVGESLAPAAGALLRELGVWNAFQALPHVRSYGVVSVWGSAEPQTHSYVSNIYGCGYHVERAAFDRMLAQAAAAAGARLSLETALLRCIPTRDGFEVTARRAATCLTFRTRVLIDATGRRAQVARQLGAERLIFDRAVAVAAPWDGSTESHLVVEATPDGWFYSAPVSQHTLSVMLMTDADLCAGLPLSAALEHAPHTRARIGSAQPRMPATVHCANSQRLHHPLPRRCQAGGYLAVGDAALAVDPIAGNGVVRALRSSRDAADTVRALLESPQHRDELLAQYDRACDDACTKYLLERADYYAAEGRFDSPYWRRRARCRSHGQSAMPNTQASASAEIAAPQ